MSLLQSNGPYRFEQKVEELESILDDVSYDIQLLKTYHHIEDSSQYLPDNDNGWFKVTDDGKVLTLNELFLEVFGYSRESSLSFRKKMLIELIPDHLQQSFQAQWETAIQACRNGNGRDTVIKTNGLHRTGYEIPIAITVASDDTKRLFVSVKDVSYRKEIEKALLASRENYRVLAETATDAIIQIKNDFIIHFANSAVKKIFAYKKEEVENRNIGILFPASRYKNYKKLFSKYFFIDDIHRKDTGLQSSIEVLGLRKDGEVLPLEISFGNSSGVGDKRILTCIIRDIAFRKKAERRLKYLAYHDKLTSLGNRDRLSENLDQVLQEMQRDKSRKAALLFLDLDGFKKVNDSLGHEMGDIILKETARRLSDCLRSEDQVYRIQMEDIYRLGGDEFTLLLPHIRRSEDAAIVATRIIDRILEPFMIKGYGSITNVNMGVSIGIALIPDDGADKNTLLRNADTAMYNAKEQGNTYMFFTREMNNRALDRLMMEEGLRSSLGSGDFSVHYQPIVDENGTIKALEALIRWTHPEMGFIPPDRFIGIAEDTRLILPIGKWVMETACRSLKKLHLLGNSDLYMSINISTLQLEREDLAANVKAILEKFKLDPTSLTLELTETGVMTYPETAIRKMKLLLEVNKGLRIAIDDFGTGYSSLSYLSKFPVKNLKIDKSFVGNMDDSNNIKIINSILSLGQNLGLNIIAEGVEEKSQLEYLAKRGCHYFQGYYFYKPLRFDDLVEELRNHR